MHRSRIVLLIIGLCFSTNIVFAQNHSDLAAGLDESAAKVGLPTGDSMISPAEKSLASAFEQEITGFGDRLSEFAASSSQNSTWIDSLQSTVQTFNQQDAAASAQDRALAVSQYNADFADLQSQVSGDSQAQAILNSLDQASADAPLTAEASDAYAQQIMNVVNEYNRAKNLDEAAQVEAINKAFEEYNRARNAEEAAQVEAINKAFQDYSRENAQKQGRENLSAPDQDALIEAVNKAVNEYLDASKPKHKEIIKRRLNRLIEIMVPSQILPINGYWRPLPYTTQISGQCINTWGDNDGPGTSGAHEDNPGEPLCGYANAGKIPFLTWHGETHPYLAGTSSMYGQDPVESTYVVRNKQGQTVRSVKVSTFTEYEVISPTQIRVHMFMQEDGGCTMNANYILELVTADDSVCPVRDVPPTPEPTPTVEPPEPRTGPYSVALPSVTDETQCTNANTLPVFDEIDLFEQPDSSIKLEYGTGSQILFPDGKDYYVYDSGLTTNNREQISLSFDADHTTGMIFWSIRNDGDVCSASMDFALPGHESTSAQGSIDTGSSEEEPTENTDPSGSTFTLAEGKYDVTWKLLPSADCTETLQAQLPKFATATITVDGSGFILEGDGNQYSLVSQSGQFMYTASDDDGGMDYMGIFSRHGNGELAGVFSRSLADGSTCISTVELAPA